MSSLGRIGEHRERKNEGMCPYFFHLKKVIYLLIYPLQQTNMRIF